MASSLPARSPCAPTLRLYTEDPSTELRESTAGLSPAMRLSEFFERYFLPVVLRLLSPETVASYQESLAWWIDLAGDPPLEAIDDFSCVTFTEKLAAQKGRKAERLAPHTIVKHVRQLQRILNFCGPRSNRSLKRAARLLPEVPLLETVELPDDLPDGDLSFEEVQRLLAHCDQLETPRLPGIATADWWQALLLAAYWMAFRLETLLGLEWRMLQGEFMIVPPAILKGRKRDLEQYCHPAALAALAKIRPAVADPTAKIFLWPHCERWLQAQRQKLMRLAGMSAERMAWRGFHALRKTHLTGVAEDNEVAAMISAGHQQYETTMGSYVSGKVQKANQRKIRKQGIQALRDPLVAASRQRELF